LHTWTELNFRIWAERNWRKKIEGKEGRDGVGGGSGGRGGTV